MEKEQIRRISDIRERVEFDSKELDSIVDAIIRPYTKEMDDYVAWIKKAVTDYENPPTTQELDEYIMTLPVFIYTASGMQEQLGIKNDIAKAVYNEMYHSVRDSLDKGTVADKNSLAELASQEEAITSMLYKRSYATVRAKVEAAQELLSSIKKVVSRRMQEYEITNISGGK